MENENPLTSAVKTILEFSPPMALLVGLLFFGTYLKKTPLQDWIIPLILMIAGALIYPFIAELKQITNYTMRAPIVYNVLIGACLGGAATGLHQIVKKFVQRNFEINIDGGDTTIIEKTKELVIDESKKVDPIPENKPTT